MLKYYAAALLGLAWAAPLAAQSIPPETVEIWGLPAGTDKASFLKRLESQNKKLCMADIQSMGYPDVNKFDFDHVTLVTLRTERHLPCALRGTVDFSTTGQLNTLWQMRDLHTLAYQAAVRTLAAARAQDTAALRTARQSVPARVAGQYQTMLQHLQRTEGPSFEQALAVLCSVAPDTLQEKALAQVAARLQTREQARQLLPYTRASLVSVAAVRLVQGFYRYHPVPEAEWPLLLPEVTKSLASPDPTVALSIAQWLTAQRVPRAYASELLGQGSSTLQEILQGQHPDLVEWKQQVYPLLSHLSASSIQDSRAALAYLNTFQPKKN